MTGIRGWLLGAAAALAGCTAAYQPMGATVGPGHLEAHALVATDGERLPLRSWMPPTGAPRAVILALHGMNDYSRAFEMAATYWARRGVATYAYDQRGFGASGRPGIWPGAATLAADLEAAAHAVAQRHPGTPLYVLGESMGGAVVVTALAAAASRGRPPFAGRAHGVILSAPALWGRQTMGIFHRGLLWLAYHSMPGLPVEPPAALKIRPSDNEDMLQALRDDPLVIKRTRIDAIHGLVDLMSRAYDDLLRLPRDLPILAMYGLHEQVLDRRAVTAAVQRLAAMQAASRLRLAVYERGYHMLLRDRCARAVWDDVLAWVDDPEIPLPSGAESVAWEPATRDAATCPAGVAPPVPGG